MDTLYHQKILLQALKQAQKRAGQTAPNPAVGAVLVKDGQVVACGYHEGPGMPHAEVMALQGVAVDDDMVLYITLEPCCHYGRTPPCTELIITRGIRTVVFAFKDPNPYVAGKGQLQLQQAGVDCQYCPIEAIDDFYQHYAYWQQTAKPWVTLKIALSANAEIAHHDGAPAKITGVDAKIFTHQQRLMHSAILTTAQTVINDDPQLNVRLQSKIIAKPVFVLDAKQRCPKTARLMKTAEPFVRLTPKTFPELIYNEANDSKFNLPKLINFIGEQGYHSVWVEAGGQLLRALLKERCVNRLIVYIAPSALEPPGLKLCTPFWPQGERVASLKQYALGDDQVFDWLFE